MFHTIEQRIFRYKTSIRKAAQLQSVRITVRVLMHDSTVQYMHCFRQIPDTSTDTTQCVTILIVQTLSGTNKELSKLFSCSHENEPRAVN